MCGNYAIFIVSNSHQNLWPGDQNFQRKSIDLPSQTLSNRATTGIHIKNMNSFCFASVDHRPSIDRQSRDILGVEQPSVDEIHIMYISIT